MRVHWFGTIEVIEDTHLAVPGSLDTVQLRAQQPDGPYGGSRLNLLDGRNPMDAGEIAVTDDLSDELGIEGLNATVTPGEREWTVVGRVENPLDLGDEFDLRRERASPRLVGLLLV